jgi:hypothetical protein
LLDEVSLYNRALSVAEILAIYNADVAGKCLVAPSITTQPQNQTIPLGEDVKFTATVSGTRPLTYQWRFNGAVIAGATNATLLLEKVKTNQAGFYHVSVTNALGFAISARAQLALLPAPSCTATPDGLISWWPGDGLPADAMGANNISEFLSSNYATGKVARAFGFNGISTRAVVLNSPSLNFGSNANFSIEMWIKAGASNTVYANVPLLEKRTGGSTWAGYSLSLNQGRLAFALGSGANPVVSSYVSAGPDLRDAMFHHVAVTVNRSATNGGVLYVDGAPVLTFDPTPRNQSLVLQGLLYLGGPTTATIDSYFGGQIDEPAIYSRVLSAAEILAIRNAGAAGKCKVPPVILAQPVSQRVTIGSNVTFSVTANGSPKLSYQWLWDGSAGRFPFATNDTLTFTVGSGRQGNYSVRVTNIFGSVLSSNAVLTLNNRPTIDAANFSTSEDVPAPVRFFARDQEQDPLTLVIVTPPAHGTLSGPLTNLIYTPAPNYYGTDLFVLKLNDGLADSLPATVNVTVLPVNDAPVAYDQSVTLDEDTTALIIFVANDMDDDALTFSVVTPPAHGVFNTSGYTPATNYFGADSFTYRVSDGKTNSNIATVSLTVRPVNDAPFARMSVSPLVTNLPGVTNWVVLAAVCDDARVTLDGSASRDVENDALSYTWLEGTNQIASGVIATNLFSPGSHELSLQVSDGQAVGVTAATVEVIMPEQGLGILIVLLQDANLGRNNLRPLVASLKNAAAAFERCDAKPGINQLEAFRNKVRAQIAPLNPALAKQLEEAIEQLLRAVR